jgi:hypothetical protein
MSNCECDVPVVNVAVEGLKFALNAQDLQGISGSGISYSFEEQWTGKTWVDGKKIYQKTVQINQPQAKSFVHTPHNINNVERVIDLHTVAFVTTSDWSYFFSFPGGGSGDVYMVANRESISSYAYGALQTYEIYSTILYTCTDR